MKKKKKFFRTNLDWQERFGWLSRFTDGNVQIHKCEHNLYTHNT